MLLSWLRAFGEFGATIILAYHPYSLPIFAWVQFSSTGLPSALPPAGVAVLAAALVLVLANLRVPALGRLLRRYAATGSPVLAAPELPLAASRRRATGWRSICMIDSAISSSSSPTSPRLHISRCSAPPAPASP